jgi:hypothetical protein
LSKDDMKRARRDMLRMMAASGAWGAAGVSGWISQALAKGDLGAAQGVNRLEGNVTVGGKAARVGTTVQMGDRIATGAGSMAVIVVRDDAFLLRSQTVIEVKGREGVLSGLLVTTGRVLSVFARKPVSIRAANASIGIRGTGAYLEVDAAGVYFCLCYGEALVEGPRMQAKLVKTTHHEQPLLLRDEGGILHAEPGPFRNHSDDELTMLEALVGREPPFMKGGTSPATKY